MHDLPFVVQRDWFARCGIASGIPLGALALDVGGWLLVVGSAVFLFVLTLAAYYIACRRHLTHASTSKDGPDA
jgi:hypothetical protein